MNEYEKWRVWLAVAQIFVTLGSPFVLIYVNNKLNKDK
jgi:hypothetical protein